jgi:2-hydroxychromene-2-carboxylate isomerase
LLRQLKARGVQALLSDGMRDAHRLARRAARVGGGRRIRFYYRLDDPYAHLLTQVLPELVQTYGLVVEVVVVCTPPKDVLPQPELWSAFAERDARDVGQHVGLAFPDAGPISDVECPTMAASALLAEADPTAQLDLCRHLGAAYWDGDREAFAEVLQGRARLDAEATQRRLHDNYRALRKRGHYHAGMLEYEGEWYWGVDRLWHLRERMVREGLAADALLPQWGTVRSEVQGAAGGVLEYYYSFRSPYSYLSVGAVRDLVERTGVELEIRLVMPMVMRGLPVPFIKQLYIARDCKREARRLGVPFGHIADPVGVGVERLMAVYEVARVKGRALEFMESAGRGVWAEGHDVATDAGLRLVSERAGIDWDEARASLDQDDDWRAHAEANRAALFDAGLWGVPSFRYGDFATWGQDRLFILETKIRAAAQR